MGLAGPRKRRKIGHDPNNTSWANDETTFGRKLLESQGWKPGTPLGAKNAAHAEYFSAASSSNIRITLKEGNLGLGAKQGKEENSNFGLSALQDIYGRLNGKSETVLAKEQAQRADLDRRRFIEQRWGGPRFVRGGFLVGDKIQDAKSTVPADVIPLEPLGKESESTMDMSAGQPKSAMGRVGKDGKTRKDQESNAEQNDSANAGRSPLPEGRIETKAERRSRKEEKRRRKAEKRARKDAERDQVVPDTRGAQPVDSMKRLTEEPEASKSSIQGSDSTVLAAVAHGLAANSRNSVRSRFIKQKRMASMDPQALREILMLKA